jgi:hypothetical protein
MNLFRICFIVLFVVSGRLVFAERAKSQFFGPNDRVVPSCDYPLLVDDPNISDAINFFSRLQSDWSNLSFEKCWNGPIENHDGHPLYKNMISIKRAIGLIDRCEFPKFIPEETIKSSMDELLASDQIIDSGLGHHLPAALLKCYGKTYRDSGNCNVSRKLREYIHREAIRDQLSDSGSIYTTVFSEINCRDLDHAQYFLRRAAESENYLYLPIYAKYLLDSETSQLIQSAKDIGLRNSIDALCVSNSDKDSENKYLKKLTNKIGICK